MVRNPTHLKSKAFQSSSETLKRACQLSFLAHVAFPAKRIMAPRGPTVERDYSAIVAKILRLKGRILVCDLGSISIFSYFHIFIFIFLFLFLFLFVYLLSFLLLNYFKIGNEILFTRMYRLHPRDFDKLLDCIFPILNRHNVGGRPNIPPLVKLCITLRFLAGGSHLDISFGYDVPHSHVHEYVWEVCEAIESSKNPFLDNINFPLDDPEKLSELEQGFASIGGFNIRGTVAAGDGIIFKMQMPTNEEVEGDVTAYFTRKGYYAYGVQAFCDSNCKFLMIASKLCSSSVDNTAYISTQLSKDIKEGKLPPQYHVVLDEAYPCVGQEMSPWKGRELSKAKDSFNYYLSLHRQCIERAFGILVQRWGIFWRPLRVTMEHRGLLIKVICKLHNICMDRFKARNPRRYLIRGSNEFADVDCQSCHDVVFPVFTDVSLGQGYRSDREISNNRLLLTQRINDHKLYRPNSSRFSRQLR